MKITFFHINTFVNSLFKGNPAAVCLLDKWLPDETLQTIAIENNLPVTAFLVPHASEFSIRWFTPDYELNLCGHGTLAAAFVIFNYLKYSESTLNLLSIKAGLLNVQRQGDFITLNFPAKEMVVIPTPEAVASGLGASPTAAYQQDSERIILIFDNEEIIKNLQPNISILKMLPYRGIVVTAPGKTADFVSRTFYPHKTTVEDQVTGASHTLLVPYWSKRLNKIKLQAHQISSRGGELICEYRNQQVSISGKAVLYLKGDIFCSR